LRLLGRFNGAGLIFEAPGHCEKSLPRRLVGYCACERAKMSRLRPQLCW